MSFNNFLTGFASVNPFPRFPAARQSDYGAYATITEDLKRLADITGSAVKETFVDRVLLLFLQRLLGQACCTVMMMGAIVLAMTFADKNEAVACLPPVVAIVIQITVQWLVKSGKLI